MKIKSKCLSKKKKKKVSDQKFKKSKNKKQRDLIGDLNKKVLIIHST